MRWLLKSSPTVLLLQLLITSAPLVNKSCAGPPLQGEIPIGLYPNGEDLLEFKKDSGVDNKVSSLNGNLNQEPSYRLPLSVQPIHYNLEIRPILDSTDPNEQFKAPGKVEILVECFQTTNSITLHSKEIDIQHDQITVIDADSEENVVVTDHTVDEDRSFYVILLAANLSVGKRYRVTIIFTAEVAPASQRMDGLYLSTYKDPAGTTKYLATTQFQKADAMKAFPCFDEPSTAFRATFDVKIGRKEATFHSLFNTERIGDPEPIPGLEGWVWDKHAVTVNMPVYLIAIIVSDFKSETAPEDLYRLPVKTWAAPPLMTETSGKFSAQAAARMLTFFEEYFDYEYQLNKMDSVAIPDFAAGAMENWGLNTYRTNLMVWFEHENTRFERWRSAAVIAHELTHQWFGNLVTCEWWHDTWLNEGFARYMQFIAASHSGEDFRSLDRYVIDTTQLAMVYDEGENTEPVHSNITDRIVNQASRIVYEKAAALIRMMQSFLTEDTLIKALRVYLKNHEYSGVGQDDLFTALTEQAETDGTFTQYTVKEIMDTWTLQSGFPIVRVSRVDGQRLYISQEKFRVNPISNRADNSLWYVPISYVTARNPSFEFANTRPKTWIEKDTLLKSLTVDSTDEWIIVNPDAKGFYRVIYDTHLTGLIQQQLEQDPEVISFASRSQLIDDYFKSAAAKYVNIQSALGLTRYLNKENDFIVWTTVVNNFSPLNTRLADTQVYEKFKEYVLGLVKDPLEKIGVIQSPTEPADKVVLRTMLMDFACTMGHEICRQTAEELFAEWIGATTPPEKIPVATDLQPMIYCGAVAFSNDSANTAIQDFLLEEYGRNRDSRQQSLIINALACDQVEDNLERLAEKAIDTSSDNEIVVDTHGLQLLQSIARNSAGRQLLIDFIIRRQTDITQILGQMAIPNLISTLAPYLSSKSVTSLPTQVEEFTEELLAQPNLPSNVRSSLESSLATMSGNTVWMNYYYSDVQSWLENNA